MFKRKKKNVEVVNFWNKQRNDRLVELRLSKERLERQVEKTIIANGVIALYPEGADKDVATKHAESEQHRLLSCIGEYDSLLNTYEDSKGGTEMNSTEIQDNGLTKLVMYGVGDGVGCTATNKAGKDINVPYKYEIDCNECEHLNMTEQEQINKREPHICLFYNVRVLHNIDRQPHNSKLYTCSECARDNYVQFKIKKATKRR